MEDTSTDDPRLTTNFSPKFPTEGQGVYFDLGADPAAVAVERVERKTYGSDGHLCRHVERHGGKADAEFDGVFSTDGKADETLVCGWQDEEDKEKTCQEILAMLQSCISDSHPRVRYAVIYTIGQMALAFEVSADRTASSGIGYWAESKIDYRRKIFPNQQPMPACELCPWDSLTQNRVFSVKAP
jgi:hypothetical protein